MKTMAVESVECFATSMAVMAVIDGGDGGGGGGNSRERAAVGDD